MGSAEFSLGINRVWHTFDHTNGGHTYEVCSVAFSSDENTLASASYDCSVKIYQRDTSSSPWTIRHTFNGTNGGHTSWINSIAFNPDGNTLASGSNDCSVKIYQRDTSSSPWTIHHTFNGTNGGHTNWINSIAFSPDGNTLASGSYDCSVKIYIQCFREFKHSDSDGVSDLEKLLVFIKELQDQEQAHAAPPEKKKCF